MEKPVVPIEYARDVSLPAAPVGPRAIFWRWERRRPLYNVVLVVVSALSLPFAGPSIRLATFWMEVLFGALIANACFFAGPMLESYLDWLGRRPRRLGTILMITGTAFASLLAIVCIATTHPDFNF